MARTGYCGRLENGECSLMVVILGRDPKEDGGKEKETDASINRRPATSMLDAILPPNFRAILDGDDVPEKVVENFIERTPIEIIVISFWAVIENKTVACSCDHNCRRGASSLERVEDLSQVCSWCEEFR
jgi:hypothetical protein